MSSQPKASNKWSSGLFECDFSKKKECCISIFCFPYIACKTAKRYGECFCLPLLDGFGLFPPVTISMRASMRQRYGIEGTIFRDCTDSFCCCPCAWCQMSREMDVREPVTSQTK